MIRDQAAYQLALGRELSKARRARGWTRKDLAAALPSPLSVQTLATYELGTRQCSVPRLVELCEAMEVEAEDVVAEMRRRVFGVRLPPGAARLDVRALLTRQMWRRDPLLPLRHWAAARFGHDGPGEVYLSPEAVQWLARLFGVSVAEMLRRLGPYSPTAAAAAAERLGGERSGGDADGITTGRFADPGADHPVLTEGHAGATRGER